MYMNLQKNPMFWPNFGPSSRGNDRIIYHTFNIYEENAKLSLLIQRHSFVRCCEIAWRRKGQSMKKVQQMQPLAVFYKCYLE